MTGTISKRKYRSGKVVWYFQIDLGKDAEGERQRITESGFATKAEAVAARDRFIAEKQRNRLVIPSKQTVKDYLAEWLDQHADKNLGRTTAARYRILLEKYVYPRIGAILLRDLDAGHLERMYGQLRENGSLRENGGKLSGKTVHHVHGTLHSALSKAVRWKRIAANPADSCDVPKVKKAEIKTPDQNEAQFILDTLEGTSLYIPALIAAFTGMRRGEILGLAWSDIDFDNRIITVRRSLEQAKNELQFKGTKTDKPRQFPVSDVLLNTLRKHKAEQLTTREMFGPDYNTTDDLVVCLPGGAPVWPDRFTAAYCAHVKKIGKRGYSLHTLRHHHASLLLTKGVSVAAVSKRLGHSNVSTTLNMYTHAFSRDEERAAEVIDEVYTRSHQGGPLAKEPLTQ